MQDETAKQLQSLKNQALETLAGMADQLADNDDVGIEGLLAIVHNTGRVELLGKILEKAKNLPDPSQKAQALLDLVDEIELQLVSGQEASEPPVPSQPVQG